MGHPVLNLIAVVFLQPLCQSKPQLAAFLPLFNTTTVMTSSLIVAGIGFSAWLIHKYRRSSGVNGSVSRKAWEARSILLKSIHSPLMQNLQSGVLLLDEQDRILAVNKAACDMHQRKAEDMLGQSLDLLLATQERNRISGQLEQVISRGSTECVMQGRRPDGSRFPLHLHMQKVDEWHVCCDLRDISEEQDFRQRATELESKYMMLAENSPLAISIHADNRFLYVNRTMAEMFGYADQGEMLQSLPQDIFHPRHNDVTHERYLRLRSSKVTLEPAVFQFMRHDGSSFMGEILSKSIEIEGRLCVQAMITNVTDRIESQQKLADSEKRYVLALEGGQLGTWDWNLEQGELQWNDRMFRMLGLEPGEIPTNAETYRSLLHPDDLAGMYRNLEVHFRGDTDFYENEHRLKHASGSWVWILDKGKVIDRDENGRAVRVSGTHLDISNRKLIEEQLVNSDQRHRELIQQSTEAIWRIEYDPPVPVDLPLSEQISLIRSRGVLIDCNDLMAMMYGLQYASQVRGRRVSELLAENNLDMSRERAASFIQDGYRFQDQQMTMEYPDGSKRIFLDNAEGTVVDGGLVTVWGTSRDVTEHVQMQEQLIASEQRFRQLVNKSNEAIWCLEYHPPVPLDRSPAEILHLIQQNGVLAECNDLMADLYGVESADQVIGQRTPDIAEMSTLVKTGDRIEKLIANNYSLKDEIMHLEYQDGRKRIYLYNAEGYVRDGQLIMIWGTSREVTDRLRMQEQLYESEQRYALALHASGLGTWDMNAETGSVLFNERFAEILGYRPSDLTWNFDTWIRTVHSADRQRVLAMIRRITRGETDNYEIEQRLRHVSGDWVWTLSKGQVISRDSEGKALRILGTETDITQRMRAEQQLRSSERRYREFVVNSTENLWCLAFEKPVPTDLSPEEQCQQMLRDAYISDCNARFAHSWGYQQAEQLIGKPFLDIKVEGMADKARRLFTEFIRGGYKLADDVESHGSAIGAERFFISNASGIVSHGALQMIWGTSRELTDLIVARRRLEESEQRYRDFVANSSEAIWRYDYHPPIPTDLSPEDQVKLMYECGVLAECNDVFARVYGHASAREVLGLRMKDLVPHDETLFALLHRFVVGGHRIVEGEVELNPGQLRDNYYLNSAQGIVRDDLLIMTWGTTRDITAQRLAGIALAESERQMSSMMETSPVGIFHLQLDGQVRYMNPRAEQMFGINVDQCRDQGWLNSIHPADRDRVARETEQNLQLSESLETEVRLVRNNELLWVLTQIKPVTDQAGNVTGFVGMMTDITDRKIMETSLAESEKRIRELIHTMAEGLIQIDRANRITFVNPNACIILGRTEEQLQDRDLLEFVADTDRELLIQQQTNRSLGLTGSYELDIRRPDGSHRLINITGCPQFDDSGEYVGSLATFQDVTETHQLATQLQQAQKMEAVGVLAGGIAHDFNNILQAMLGFADLAQEQLDPLSEPAACLEEISSAGLRAADLVRQMLTFSRQTEQEKSLINLSLIVNESVGLLRGSLPSTIRIVTDICETDMVVGNATQLHQVIMNLSTNAFHAMRENGGQLSITCSNTECSPALAGELELEAGSSLVRLQVYDTGHGMDSVTAARVFDPYFTTKRVGEGTGLGLATVHGIIHSMGGSINIDSEPGTGTHVEILLPSAGKLDATERLAPAPQQVLRGSETVMLVDDEQSILQMLRAGLERQGYKTLCFTDGWQAWRYWQQNADSIDVIVTDQTMPQMTGDELCRRVLAVVPDLPIVLCTGYSDLIDEATALQLGVTSFVNKPIVPRELAALIRRISPSRSADRATVNPGKPILP